MRCSYKELVSIWKRSCGLVRVPLELDEVSKVENESDCGQALHIQCAGFEHVVEECTEKAHGSA
ncbi:hypothetical protein RchiOBHm_Chr7g0183411 [Rosa chinensis]|uniref:Uncharacterized protein n=1 Tax=Rosa chinensis TaxID=74649 RepID=A0A2P6P349_ROSCH|nr:hypothetical protein RchiOBHm_Chr7g0183411 [Rosa chinensis]